MDQSLPPGLYIVATPIGNLGDLSPRAAETLRRADHILAEDKRVTAKLLAHAGAKAPMSVYHDHSRADDRARVLERVSKSAVALVSDAGTPLISDPGYKLVRAACEAGHTVTALPGPSSILAALSVAGLPTDRFFFEGFLPAKSTARQKRVAELANIPSTLVLFESGSRLAAMLADLAISFGKREAAICRELTKLHEEIRRGDLETLARDYAAGAESRGEFVVVVAPPDEDDGTPDDVDELLRQALRRVSVKDAVGEVALATGRPRREVYQRALILTKDTVNGGK